MRGIAVVLAGAALVGSAHALWSTQAYGEVHTNVTNNGPLVKTGSDGGSFKAESIVNLDLSDFSDDAQGVHHAASASINIDAQVGRLHASGAAWALDPINGHGGGTAFFSGDGNHQRRVAGWSDTLKLVGATPGAFVEGNFHTQLDATFTLDYPGTSFPTNAFIDGDAGGANGSTPYLENTGSVGFDIYFSGYDGQVIAIDSYLYLSGITGSTPDTSIASSVGVDASHTALSTVTITTPGADYISESGYRYNALPEPASMFTLAGGALLGVCRRRR